MILCKNVLLGVSWSSSLLFHTHLQKAVRACATFRQAASRTRLRHRNRSLPNSLRSATFATCASFYFFRGTSWSEFVSRSQLVLNWNREQIQKNRKIKRKETERKTDRFKRSDARERSNATGFRVPPIASFDALRFLSFPLFGDVDISVVTSLYSQK